MNTRPDEMLGREGQARERERQDCLALAHTVWPRQYDETGSQTSWGLVQNCQLLE